MLWLQVALVAVGVSVSGLVAAERLRTLWATPTSTPPSPGEPSGEPRQVTVFAIRALPGVSKVDPRLSTVKAQLRKVLPDHGFELIESKSGSLVPGESLACDLGRGWRARTTRVLPSPDDFGRVRLRCELLEGDETRFSTDVDAPENQLFFYERELGDGVRVLIGVGAR
jgi:hypothetical protein